MPSIQSPELQSKLALWRLRAAEGTITREEMREAILHLRADRLSAADASAKSKSKARAKGPVDVDSLLDSL